MRHLTRMYNELSKRYSRMGKRSQEVQRNKRLEHLVDIRPTTSTVVFVLLTFNPFSGAMHYIELRHDIENGKDRYNVYLNGEKWRNSWSRTGFTEWLFKQIDSVRVDWEN